MSDVPDSSDPLLRPLLCGVRPQKKSEAYEEDESVPGDAGEQYIGLNYDFVRLREHREKTGNHWWCMECWIKLTTPEISSHWKDECLRTRGCVRSFGHFTLDDGSVYYIRQSFGLRRCSDCKQWLQVPHACPVVETTRYTVLCETAGQPIDGWYFGVRFKAGKPVDVRCAEHMGRRKKAA